MIISFYSELRVHLQLESSMNIIGLFCIIIMTFNGLNLKYCETKGNINKIDLILKNIKQELCWEIKLKSYLEIESKPLRVDSNMGRHWYLLNERLSIESIERVEKAFDEKIARESLQRAQAQWATWFIGLFKPNLTEPSLILSIWKSN